MMGELMLHKMKWLLVLVLLSGCASFQAKREVRFLERLYRMNVEVQLQPCLKQQKAMWDMNLEIRARIEELK